MNKTEQKNKAETGIIYCRVSSKDQIDGTSLGSQERACQEYAERNNIKVLKIYIERGESAKTADRTEFNKALTFCTDKKKKVDRFIVYKLDRFARNQDDHVTVRTILKRSGTELRSVTEPFDNTSMGRAMEGMLSVFAELDNNMRTERTKQGMLERLKQGIWPWSAPLGYFRPHKGSNLFPEPQKAPLIRLAFEKYAEGTYTYKKLAEFLAERGLRTKSGKEPSPQLMEKILKNKIYSGVMDVWDGHEGAFEPIVSKELFAKCQNKNKDSNHAKPRSANNSKFPLRKLVTCDKCETPLTGSVSRGRNKQYAYYHHGHQKCLSAQSIPKEAFEQLFTEYLDSLTPSIEYEKMFKGVVLDIWQNNYKRLDSENEKVRKDIVNLEKERQKVFDFHRDGKYTDDEFLGQKKLIQDRIDGQYILLQDNRVAEFSMEEALDHCFNYVRNTTEKWVTADYPKKLRLQRMIFKSKVEFDGKKFGTAELSQVYKINQTFQSDKSSLVAPRGVEPLLPG